MLECTLYIIELFILRRCTFIYPSIQYKTLWSVNHIFSGRQFIGSQFCIKGCKKCADIVSLQSSFVK